MTFEEFTQYQFSAPKCKKNGLFRALFIFAHSCCAKINAIKVVSLYFMLVNSHPGHRASLCLNIKKKKLLKQGCITLGSHERPMRYLFAWINAVSEKKMSLDIVYPFKQP